MYVEKNKKVQYFLYTRKSSENSERQVRSNEDQTDEMMNLADRNNLEVIEKFTEERSAKAPDVRIEFYKMLDAIKKGKADGILSWKLDRLSRNPLDSGRLQQLLQDNVIKSIQTINREYKPEDNALLMSVENGMSNQFILDLRINSMRGTNKKAERGWMPSRAPLGYKNIGKIQGEKYIVPDKKRFDLVREMWNMVLARNSMVKILRTANKDWGMLTPQFKNSGGKELSRSQVYAMFSNIFYTGKFIYMSKIYQGQHEAMITEGEFEQVQNILGRNNNTRSSKHKFAYTGLIKCGCGCGNSITAETKTKILKTTGEEKSYTFYRSTKRKKGTICKQKPISEIELQKQVLNNLEKIKIDPDILEWAFDIVDKNAEKEKKNKEKVLKVRDDNIKSKDQELSNLKHMRMKDFINDNEFLEEKERLEKEIANFKKNKINDIKIDQKAEELKNDLFFMSEAKQQMTESQNTDENKKILSYFGTNHILVDKQFDFSVRSWQTPVLTDYKKVEKDIKRLEPTNHYIKQGKNEHLLLACPSLGRMIDEVWKRYRI